jgi:hypothetical protein
MRSSAFGASRARSGRAAAIFERAPRRPRGMFPASIRSTPYRMLGRYPAQASRPSSRLDRAAEDRDPVGITQARGLEDHRRRLGGDAMRYVTALSDGTVGAYRKGCRCPPRMNLHGRDLVPARSADPAGRSPIPAPVCRSQCPGMPLNVPRMLQGQGPRGWPQRGRQSPTARSKSALAKATPRRPLASWQGVATDSCGSSRAVRSTHACRQSWLWQAQGVARGRRHLA